MEVGTLIRGEINGLIGVVTHFMEWGSQDCVKIYWVVLQLPSTIWVRPDELEIICK